MFCFDNVIGLLWYLNFVQPSMPIQMNVPAISKVIVLKYCFGLDEVLTTIITGLIVAILMVIFTS